MTEAIAGFNAEYVALVEAHYKDIKNGPLTPTEFKIYLERAAKANLDPLSGQILPTIRKTEDDGTFKRALVFMTTIDALRLVADRTKQYAPGQDTQYGGNDPSWGAPEWARVFVKKLAGGVWHEYSGQAFFGEYVQLKYDKKTVVSTWKKMPNLMIAKCAEALALRRGFPNDLAGLYVSEELDQASNPEQDGNRFGEPPRLLKTFEEHFEQEKKEALEVLAKCGIEIPSKPPHKSTAFPFGANASDPNASDPPPNPDANSLQPSIQPSPTEIGPAGQENAEVPKSPKIAKKISPAKRGVLFAAVRESTRPDWTGRDEKTRQAELKKVLLTLKTDEHPDGITSSLQIPDVSFDLILAWVKTGTFGALRAVVGQ